MLFSWTGFGTLIGVVAAVTAGLHLTQRYAPHPRREKHNDVAGFIFAAIAVFYAVLVAFVIVALWSDDGTARQTTYSEGNDLASVYWLSRHMPLAQGRPLEHLTLEYAHTVIEQEWPLMASHHSSPAATALIYQIRNDAFSLNPATPRDQVIFEEVTTSVTALAADRRERLDAIGDGVPVFLWAALIGGGIITVGFTFLFGLSSTWVHVVMVGLFAAVIVVSLILIKDLNYPFAGPGKVSPEAFEVFLSRLPPPR
ncbi:MAG TPA: hypothetical protein VFB06_01340 [Streptosporangiaceae bacterium]|nr:hypothetical protein [Streptosporangiaceae bacterium]